MANSTDDALSKRSLYVFDLPAELLATLRLATDITSETDDKPEPLISNSTPITTSADGHTTRVIACALCGASFATVPEQRVHAKSDWHGYNLKQKLRGLTPVSEVDFDLLVGDLDESISGSDSSDSDSDSGINEGSGRGTDTMLSALLRRQAHIAEPAEEESGSRKVQPGYARSPLIWFTSPNLPQNTCLGIYRALFTQPELQDETQVVEILRKKQLSSDLKSAAAIDSEGGVPLPKTYTSPSIFMCMIGGGHFAGMVVSLVPKMGKKHGVDERQASVVAHKTFHRYTTRRKQGGSQSANDAAKGAAHSAGSSLRRYNEAALTAEVRELLTEWKGMIDTCKLIFVRATGSTNRRTLFGPYEGQILRNDDPRNRGFPFSTRRATQGELLRSFVELTRVKVNQIDEAALAAARNKSAVDAEAQNTTKSSTHGKIVKAPAHNSEHEEAILHTTQIESLIRRSKAPALLTYLSSNSVDPNFRLFPPDTQAHHHAPTALHLASSINSPALVIALLVKAGADPTITNAQGKSSFEVAGGRATRHAYRQARAEIGEERWDWDGLAKVPEPLSKAEVDAINKRDRLEEEQREEARRKAGLESLNLAEQKKEDERRRYGDERREKTMGKGHLLSAGRERTAEQRREEEARGMSPEMKMRLEREQRARAAEERMKRMQTAGAGTAR